MDHADLLAELRLSQQRAEVALAFMADADARGPSLLPGWTRGHLITHLARNADGLNRLAAGAIAGEPAEMYPGGPPAREAAIAEGADRPLSLLAADFHFAGRRVVQTIGQLGPDALDTPVAWRRVVPAREVAMLRWRELEVHLVDLGLDYQISDWPESFVELTLAAELPTLGSLGQDIAVPDIDRPDLLAWLLGRPTSGDLPPLPALPPWPFDSPS